MKINLPIPFIFLWFAFVLVSCKSNEPVTSAAYTGNEKYISGFPSGNVSGQLEDMSEVVKKLDCLAFYMTYIFPEGSMFNKDSLANKDINKVSSGSSISNKSVSGTATMVYYDGKVLGMLTCAHVVDFADTIYNWYDENHTKLSSVSVKLRQQNYVAGLPGGNAIEIVAMDKKSDIAILRKELAPHMENPQVLSMNSIGKTKDLAWGTFVYIMGYPLGNLMVTRAIISNPGKAKGDVFLTDALYNKGISGSPVFAMREGADRLEWVGMARSAFVDHIVYLKPDEKYLEVIDTERPYEGNRYVDQSTRINYGITYSVTTDAILRFFKSNKEELEKAGIYFGQLEY